MQGPIARDFVSINLPWGSGVYFNRNPSSPHEMTSLENYSIIYWLCSLYHTQNTQTWKRQELSSRSIWAPRITIYLQYWSYQLLWEYRKIQLGRGVMREDDAWPESWRRWEKRTQGRSGHESRRIATQAQRVQSATILAHILELCLLFIFCSHIYLAWVLACSKHVFVGLCSVRVHVRIYEAKELRPGLAFQT